MTSRTSLIISGSRAEVGSSKSITLGSMASDAGDGHPLLLAAGELRGVLVGLVGDADPLEQLAGPRRRRRPCDFLRTLIGPSVTFSQDRLVREQVERLEDHADVGAQLGQLLALARAAAAPSMVMLPVVDRLEAVDGAAQRRLARARRADDDDDLAACRRSGRCPAGRAGRRSAC